MKNTGFAVLALIVCGLLAGCSFTDGIPKPLVEDGRQEKMDIIVIADSQAVDESMKEFSSFLSDFSLPPREETEGQFIVGPTQGIPGLGDSRGELVIDFLEYGWGTEIRITGAYWKEGEVAGGRERIESTGFLSRIFWNMNKKFLSKYRGWNAMHWERSRQLAEN